MRILLAFVAVAVSAVSAFAEPVFTPPLKGHYEYCQKNAWDCQPTADPHAKVRFSQQWLDELSAWNAVVNRSIKQVNEEGLADVWRLPLEGEGDCEDIALYKRLQLIAANVPVAAARMTVVEPVRAGAKEYHTVLVIETDRGPYVFDNRRGEVLPFAETGYRLYKQQSRYHAGKWEAAATLLAMK